MGAASQQSIREAGAGLGTHIPYSSYCAATFSGLPSLICLCREDISIKCAQTNLQRTFFCSGRTMYLEFKARFP